MRNFNTVVVTQVQSLEPGDLIAMEFLGEVISGRVTGTPYSAYDLTPEQRTYMGEHDLSIPENPFAMLDNGATRLIFGNFNSVRGTSTGHMYVDPKTTVAVFPTN